MSRERRIALLAAIAGAVALVVAALALSGSPAPSERPSPASVARPDDPASEPTAVAEEAERVAAEEEVERAREAERDQAGEEGELGAEVLARERRARAAAEPVARRFFAAFARYELGDDSDVVAGEIAATATPALARELARPPRIPADVARPKQATLARDLQLVPLDGGSGELTEIELVGEVERAAKRSPISFRMVLRGGRWRVAALG